MEKKTFAGVCTVMSTLPSHHKWDDQVAAVYLTIMKDWDDRVVGALMRHVLLHCEFRPTVAELRRMGLQMFGNIPSKSKAVHEIKRVITQWASDRDNHASQIHPCLPAIVHQAGGWAAIGLASSEKAFDIIGESYNSVMSTYGMDSYLTHPEQDKLKDVLEGGARTVKAITE